MRWLLMGLLALNVLQGIYIFSYEDTKSSNIKVTAPNPEHLSTPHKADVTSHKALLALDNVQAPPSYDSNGIAVLSQEVRVVSRSLVNKLVESGKGLNTVRFALWPKGGFLATYVKQASVVARLGLMKGDVVKSINNTQMSSVLHALSIYQDLEDLNFLELGIERKGKAISYFYKLTD